MSFSIAGLTDYVEQNKLPLLTTAVFDAKTQSLMQKRVGVKNQDSKCIESPIIADQIDRWTGELEDNPMP